MRPITAKFFVLDGFECMDCRASTNDTRTRIGAIETINHGLFYNFSRALSVSRSIKAYHEIQDDDVTTEGEGAKREKR